MRTQTTLATLLLLATLPVLSTPAHAAITEPAAVQNVQRTLDLLSVVVEEYREGVADGKVVIPIEYEEARGFLREAEQRYGRALPGTKPPPAFDFAVLRSSIEALQPIERVESQAAQLRDWLRNQTGVVEQVFPPAPPSMARGKMLFEENCTSCHGSAADGKGPEAARLDPPPASFVDVEFMTGESPFAFFHIIGLGRGSSAMPAWGETLSLQERWDLVSYLWSVRHGEAGLAQGQGIYLQQCASCHGASGDGRGVDSKTLIKPAPDLSTAQSLAQTSDTELFEKVTQGVAGSPMPSFAKTLTDQERWAAVAYLRQLSLGGVGSSADADPAAAARRLSGVLRMVANDYTRAGVASGTTAAIATAQVEILFAQAHKRAESLLAELEKRDASAAASLRTQLDSFAAAIQGRKPAAEIASNAAQLASNFEAHFIPADAAAAPAADALKDTRRLLEEALAAHKRGDANAVYLVSDAYFAFEPLERRLRLSNPDLVIRIEERFADLRGHVSSPDDVEQAAAIVTALHADFDTAATALQPRQSGTTSVFVQSLLIILREGFEVVLLVTALLAYVVKSGNAPMKRYIFAGTGVGVAVSLVVAFVLALLLQGATGPIVEGIEGITMLLASGVLFWVSYWLISKAEADRWQRYIQGKVKTALSRGSGIALAGTAFLAVFREGVETVLFYQALLGGAENALAPAAAGLAVGAVLLAFLYFGMVRLGMRIPIGPFFLGTSIFLYYLAVTFAGRGVAELQEAQWIGTTRLEGWPQIDFLGVYPTMQTMLAQSVLMMLLLYAVAVLWRRRTIAVAEKSNQAAQSPGANAPTR